MIRKLWHRLWMDWHFHQMRKHRGYAGWRYHMLKANGHAWQLEGEA